MKTIKTRLISTLLVVMTLLSLLPTTAFAATGTGKGITITTNQVYWSTRILANGTPYSYRPPEAAGRLLYCLDSGLGYHNATPSYCDSFSKPLLPTAALARWTRRRSPMSSGS